MIQPHNRYVLLEMDKSEPEAEKSFVLVPDEYTSKNVYRYTLARLLAKAKDCRVDCVVGDKIIVETSMMEEVAIGDSTYYLLLENHILASVGE